MRNTVDLLIFVMFYFRQERTNSQMEESRENKEKNESWRIVTKSGICEKFKTRHDTSGKDRCTLKNFNAITFEMADLWPLF